MHHSSLENMARCVDRHVAAHYLEGDRKLKVLDVGGADVNGSYRSLFRAFPQCEYIAADLQPGPNVDVVIADPKRLPFPDHVFDLVISGQMLEHCRYFWEVFQEMARVTARDGRLFLIAPSAGPIHRYPEDCYRFYPDAYQALADLAGCWLVECWLDERGPWRDLTGVFALQPNVTPVRARASITQRPVPPVRRNADPDTERTSGASPYLQTLQLVHEALTPDSYLEIGVQRGASLALARCPAIGVDPAPALEAALPKSTRLYAVTSDAFFAEHADEALPAPIDFAFIDGMHLVEFALRDFMNIERRAHAATLVVIDDVSPNHPLQAKRARETAAWTGDVWKLALILKAARPDLLLISVDTAPSGLLMIAGLNPQSRELWDQYTPS